MSDISGIGSASSAVTNAEAGISSAASAVAQDAQSAVQSVSAAPSVGTYAAIMVLLDSLTEKVVAQSSTTVLSSGAGGSGALVDDWA